MARPSVITQEQILQAAREEFLERGIRATTADVARRAKIAEGSIFKRFETKYELFSAAMHVNPEQPAFLRALDAQTTGPTRQVLAEIALEILGFMRTLMPLVMMTWSNPSPSGLPRALDMPNPLPVQVMKKLIRFFKREITAGRLRRQNPEIAARVFLGAIQNYVFFELVLKAGNKIPMPPEKYVQGMVDALWQGLGPVRKKG
jgi:AcrR family transcriptional regulator